MRFRGVAGPACMRLLSLILLMMAALLSTAAQKRPVTIFLAGDSTMAPKQPDKRPETGWGEKLESHFHDGKVRVDNRAMNGRSTTSFIAEGRWQAIVDALQKGDHVFIQFGHNDQKKDKPAVYASPEDYKANLARFIADVRAKGAVPVLMTPVSRRRFEKGIPVRTHGEYPDLVKAVAAEQHVRVIDMETKSASVLMQYGPENSIRLFLHLKAGENGNYPNGVEDNTHFSPWEPRRWQNWQWRGYGKRIWRCERF